MHVLEPSVIFRLGCRSVWLFWFQFKLGVRELQVKHICRALLCVCSSDIPDYCLAFSFNSSSGPISTHSENKNLVEKAKACLYSVNQVISVAFVILYSFTCSSYTEIFRQIIHIAFYILRSSFAGTK